MAVNLINSNDITITQTGDNIQLETPNIGNLTNLTTTDKSSLVNAINEINGEIPDIYSTSEVKTNKVWINNKPIYRIVIDLGLLGAQTTISNVISNCDKVISFDGYIINPNTELTGPLNYRDLSAWRDITYEIQNNVMGIKINRNDTGSWSNYKLYIIVEYTKTN